MKHAPGPNMLALLAEKRPGQCAACGEPFPAGHGWRRVCAVRDCRRVYLSTYKADQRLAGRAR